MRRAGSGAIASTWNSTPIDTAGRRRHDVVDHRPRPARTRLQPPRAGGAGPHRPSSLPRPATAGSRQRARDPARDGEIAPPPSAPVHASGARRRCPTSVGHPGGPSRMTLHDGFDRTVSDWLDEQAGHGMPGYLDEILTQTTRTRQRPWWSSPERWLPVQSTTRFAQVPRMVWLLIVLGSGHRARHRGPGGRVAETATGAVRSRRPRERPLRRGRRRHLRHRHRDERERTRWSTDPATDSGPILSPDGTRIAFVRRDPGSATTSPSWWRTRTARICASSAGCPRSVRRHGLVAGQRPARGRRHVDGSRACGSSGQDGRRRWSRRRPVQKRVRHLRRSPQWRPNGHELSSCASGYGPRPR